MKNTIKKATLSLGTVASIVAPIAAVVSCGGGSSSYEGYKGVFHAEGNNPLSNDFTGENRVETAASKVAFITDGGSITDKSFNEGTLRGVRGWSVAAKDVNDTSANAYTVFEVANHGKDTADFTTQYDKAAPTAAYVLPGFNHGPAAAYAPGHFKAWWTAHFTGKTPVPVVGIDLSDGDNTDKFYGITFKTEQSGFLAAVDAGFMLNKQFAAEKTTDAIKVATFGGMNIPTVTAYMNGFAKGVEWFNTHKGALKRDLQLIHINNDATKDFSGNFNPGDGSSLANQFINDGARAIMAVAGPQTADVVAAIKAKKATGGVFAIGVDVDQSGIYGGTVLTSAVKGLEAATKATLNAITGSGSTVAADKVYDLTSNVGTDMFVGSIPNKQYITSAIQSDYNAFYLKANNDLKITSGNANFIDFAADKVWADAS